MIEEALIVLCMFQQESFRLMFLIAPVNNDRGGTEGDWFLWTVDKQNKSAVLT